MLQKITRNQFNTVLDWQAVLNSHLSLMPLFVRTDPNWYTLAVSTTSMISATWTHRYIHNATCIQLHSHSTTTSSPAQAGSQPHTQSGRFSKPSISIDMKFHWELCQVRTMCCSSKFISPGVIYYGQVAWTLLRKQKIVVQYLRLTGRFTQLIFKCHLVARYYCNYLHVK